MSKWFKNTSAKTPLGIVLLFLAPHYPLICDVEFGTPQTTFLLGPCLWLGSANLKGRRREPELAPSYLSADFAIITPVGSDSCWFQFPASFCAPTWASSCPSHSAAPASQRPSPEVWDLPLGPSSEPWGISLTCPQRSGSISLASPRLPGL